MSNKTDFIINSKKIKSEVFCNANSTLLCCERTTTLMRVQFPVVLGLLSLQTAGLPLQSPNMIELSKT